MVLYIGSDRPLPLIAWREESPGFHVTEEPASSAVRRHLTEPHVYYAGSHQGCGCGFQLYEDDDEAPAKKRSLEQLADFLEARLTEGARLRMLACWDGDEGAPIDRHRQIRPIDLRAAAFQLEEGELLDVLPPRER